MRNAFDPDQLTSRAFYGLLTALVVPRPIAWVSTIGADGVDNLAPHSFFTIACVEPPIVQFSSVQRKDTLRNVEETGEFVVNFAGEEHFEAINATSTDFPRGVSEFDVLGIEREPSLRVRPPRVAGSPAVLECKLHSTVRLGDSTVVFGRVVHAAVDQKVLVNGHPEIDRLRPLARLGKDEWGTLGAVREIERVRYADWSGTTR
ncbi:flavin reductase family protein [Streptomyces sp. NPDC054766]|uniref:flavin reductase family protein n=1 Tax=Streptomyces rhizosphaerihabitans TaxID=1266770 RepID=UPI0021C17C10|nr:flavin reductase family protein [Streptomyces rhizosphaerihabitans]MCT9004757.1 flavin reductase family protein [Streptomyces rhizosphaerihabitans]